MVAKSLVIIIGVDAGADNISSSCNRLVGLDVVSVDGAMEGKGGKSSLIKSFLDGS